MFTRTFFVLSPSYHGATLLAKLINAHPEATSLGDTYPSNRYDQLCGCGARVSDCHFWQDVKERVGAYRHRDAPEMLPRYPRERGGRLGRVAFSDFASFWATPRNLRLLYSRKALSAYRADYRAFLRAVHEHTAHPGHVFVDGVKFVSRVSALQAAGLRVDGIVHLYRDAGDFVASSERRTGRGGLAGAAEHALRYRLYHARARQAARKVPQLEMTYEALADDADRQLARLFSFMGVAPLTVAELRRHLSETWHFMGNASLLAFDGTIERREHALGGVESALVRAVARGAPERLGEPGAATT